ncbi:MAG: hypothetical protein DME13_17165, partial [Candidatus Rokuibacteriota bacterium]
KRELPSLTGIRFYAALFIYLAHIRAIPGMKAFIGAPWLIDAGHIGVSFFFVLSGFILTYNYADLFRDGVSARDYGRFVWDRLTKIYPVHFLATVVVLPISILSPRLQIDWRAVPIHLGLLQCLWPSTVPSFYEQLNVPSWSISCEWFFYVLAPVTIFLAFGHRRQWVALAAMAAYLCGLGIMLWQGDDATRDYFLTYFAPTRFAEFMVGVFLARLFLNSSTATLARFSNWLLALGIVLVAAAEIFRRDVAWPVPARLLYAPGSGLFMTHEPLIRAAKGVCLYLGWSVGSWPVALAVTLGMFAVVQTAALLVCFLYELPLQNRLRRLFIMRRARGAEALPAGIRHAT